MIQNKNGQFAPPTNAKRPTTAFPKAEKQMTSLTTTQQEYQAQVQANSLPFLDFVDPAILRKRKAEVAKKKFEQILEKISFYDGDLQEQYRQYRYSKETLMPFLLFTKYLARKPDMPEGEVTQSEGNRLQLWIPDTIVLNDDVLPPMWFYSSPQGFVYRTDAFTSKNVTAKLSNYSSPDELVAVVKKIQYKEQSNICGNSVKLVSSKDAQTTVTNALQIREPTVIQKFVKSNGPKAFICRTVWRKDKNACCWVITNKADYFSEEKLPESQKYITNPGIMNSCTIVNTCRGKYVDETIPYIKNILKYFRNTIKVSFSEFICDFIKDESGIWWMINVKGFVFDNPLIQEINTKQITNYGDGIEGAMKKSKATPANSNKYQKVKECKYCETEFPENELTRKLTLKMIIQTDKHLMHRSKNFEWLSRSDLQHIDTPLLYELHKVCKTCYTLYTETEKLIQKEYQFAKLLGVPCSEETMHSLVSLSSIDPTTLETESPKMSLLQENIKEQNWVMDIARNTQLVVKNNQPSINNKVEKALDRYRMMILIHFLRDIPENRDHSKHYYLEYSIFDHKVKYRLPISQDSPSTISLNKLRICYFFTNERKGINHYINKQQILTINLLCDTKKIGQLDLQLVDFMSEKVIKQDYYKMFVGKSLPVFPLKWGLKVSLGMFNAGLVDVSKLKLQEHEGIWIPHSDYYTCEPLPQEWMQIVSERIVPLKKEISDKQILSERDQGANNQSQDHAPNEKKKGPVIHLTNQQHRLVRPHSQSNFTEANKATAPPPPPIKGSLTARTHQTQQSQNIGDHNTKEVTFRSQDHPSDHQGHFSSQNESAQQSSRARFNSSQNENESEESTKILDEMLRSEMNIYSQDETSSKKKLLKKKIYY